MMNGDAHKPFVYRSLLPRGIKWFIEQLSLDNQKKLFQLINRKDSVRSHYFSKLSIGSWTPVIAITYNLMYLTIVLATIGILLIVYLLGRMHHLSFGEALVFMISFSLLYPLTFQTYGYYYDFIELLGILCACYFVLKQQRIMYTICIAVFSFNKETFFLVPLALFFLHPEQVTLKTRLIDLALQLLICFASRFYIMSGYEANLGNFVEYHFRENIAFWTKPTSFFKFYNVIAEGVRTPSLQNPLIAVPLFIFFKHVWNESPQRYRNYFWAAFLPLIPLFICFGFKDEFRSFALAFPAITLITLHGATKFNEVFSGLSKTVPVLNERNLL
ncbi:hypothetical protein OQJ13_03550 [Legionella sp. PATHC035]|uniref:hypothetical protein n=1 Tax=Legionella sp. PATHC035 TaxID=2992040 RepID=UPI0022430F0D|nr:hypothetical protein [Legionella sp. PATHC035]MCW8408042.1 hypothetical protein [Legionella sp. PATHC035]